MQRESLGSSWPQRCSREGRPGPRDVSNALDPGLVRVLLGRVGPGQPGVVEVEVRVVEVRVVLVVGVK